MKNPVFTRRLERKVRKWGRLRYEKQEAIADQYFEKAAELKARIELIEGDVMNGLLNRILWKPKKRENI